MHDLHELFANNRSWAQERQREDPAFFSRMAEGQAPSYLWIGCSDSRVPPTEIVGMSAGDLFVHRNVANVVEPSDINALSVIHYGVSVLGVRHVVVCGHYGCGGVQAAFGTEPLGLIDAWLARIREVIRTHQAHLDGLASDAERFRRLAELNVLEQARAVCDTPPVVEAWRAGRSVSVHGVIYDIGAGLLRDLGFSASGSGQSEAAYEAALAGLIG